jgi:integral membrane protein (TIGR01906 family)
LRLVWIVAGLVAAICLPVLLITTNVRGAVNSLRLYEYGFDKYAVSRSTGMEREELRKAANGLIDYFNSSEEPIEITVVIEGEERELFNQREVIHLKDFKGLIQLDYRLQWITLSYIAVYIGIGLVWRKRAFLHELAKSLMAGSALTIAVVAAVGIGSLLDFDRFFFQLHLLIYSNDLWQLDPSCDYLIRLFPGGFFYDAILFGAVATIVEVLVIGGVAGGWWAWRRRMTSR